MRPEPTSLELRAFLRERVAERCGREARALDEGASFEALGLSSLDAVGISGELEELLGRELDPLLLYEHRSIAALARALDGEARATSSGASADELECMAREVSIELELAPLVTKASRPASVLLTGATGFLGAHLLRELLAHEGLRVLCLVRAANADEARKRLASSLGNDAALERVELVPGDLEREHLGLTPADFDALARRTGCVLHAGARVDWLAPYAELAPANVRGTRELLRLAARGGSPFHFVSSLLVACPDVEHARGVACEDAPPCDPARLVLGRGYARTKWVAEALVRAAGERGLAVAIHRPSLIVGANASGGAPSHDLLARLVRASLALEAAPRLELGLDLVEVGNVARAIVLAATRTEPSVGTFHHCADEPLDFEQLASWLARRGARLERIDARAWLARLAASGLDPALAALLAEPLAEGEPLLLRYARVGFPRFDATRTCALLGSLHPEATPIAALLEHAFGAHFHEPARCEVARTRAFHTFDPQLSMGAAARDARARAR